MEVMQGWVEVVGVRSKGRALEGGCGEEEKGM